MANIHVKGGWGCERGAGRDEDGMQSEKGCPLVLYKL